MASTTSLRPVRPHEWAAVRALLGAVTLPLDGLDERRGPVLVALDGETVVGCVALELYADAALLRSLAVHPRHRGRGLGTRLARAALGEARARDLAAVYLLTETADRFFPRFGFAVVDREAVPAGVRASVEYTSACPASAVAMAVSLT